MESSPDFGQLLDRVEKRGGEFLVSGQEVWAGPRFADAVRRAAGGLADAGVSAGDRVLLLLEKGPEFVIGLWAAIRIGAVAVPVHPKLRRNQVAHVVRDAAPAAVLTSSTRELLLTPGPGSLWAGREVWGRERSLASLRDGAKPARHWARDPDAPAIFLYSSGSTGAPKAIVQSQRTLVDGARIVAGYTGLTAADTVLAALPLSFDYGLNQVLSAAWCGAKVVLRDYLGPADLATAVRDHGVTVLAGVPTLWRDLTEWLAAEGPSSAGPLRSLRVLTNSGGRWEPTDTRALRAAFPGAALHSMYGLTEGFRSATLDPGEIDAFPDSIGRAVPEVVLDLVDPDGRVVAGAGTGELVHSGAFVGLGYWQREDDTAARFRPHPLDPGRPAVWSGDIVRRDEGGRLFFEGRIDDQLKVDGHRVSPDELSEALRSGLGLTHVAVVGLDDGVRGHRLVACVADPGVEDDIIRAWARSHLPPHLQPAELLRVPRLPRTPNGKIDRQALRDAAHES